MGGEFGPVEAGAGVMAEVVAFVHEVDVVEDGDGAGEVVVGMLGIAEGMLHPGSDGHDEVHGEKGE